MAFLFYLKVRLLVRRNAYFRGLQSILPKRFLLVSFSLQLGYSSYVRVTARQCNLRLGSASWSWVPGRLMSCQVGQPFLRVALPDYLLYYLYPRSFMYLSPTLEYQRAKPLTNPFSFKEGFTYKKHSQLTEIASATHRIVGHLPKSIGSIDQIKPYPGSNPLGQDCLLSMTPWRPIDNKKISLYRAR